MSKIDKQTLKILPRTKISIYKFVNQNTYFCRFFVGRKYFKSGRFEKTCKTKNINEANKLFEKAIGDENWVQLVCLTTFNIIKTYSSFNINKPVFKDYYSSDEEYEYEKINPWFNW